MILKRSRIQQPDGSLYTWDSLEDHQKAGMAFILNERIVDCFPQGVNKWKRIAHGVLGIDKVETEPNELIESISIHGKAIWRDLHQFVRKGGDQITSTGDLSTNCGGKMYQHFRSDYKDMWGDVRSTQSTTMFSLNIHIEPVLRFQAPFSMVCAFVVSSLIIHYRQVIHPQGFPPVSGATVSGAGAWASIVKSVKQRSKWTSLRAVSKLIPHRGLRSQKARDSSALGSGPNLSSSPDVTVAVMAYNNAIETKAGNCTLNIGRFMRRNLTAKQKYETIFEGMGFRFGDVLNALLKLSNGEPEGGSFLESINILRDEPPETLCNEVARELKHGALCAQVRLYEGYEESSMCVKEPEMKFTQNFHFVAIIGVSRTQNDQHGGVMFLAQDSCGQPFKNISLELLREMGSAKRLWYIPHDTGIKMPNGSVFDLKPEDIVTAGGLQLKRSELPRCTPVHLSEEERKELEERQEELKALVDPDYIPEWARKFAN